MTKLFLIDYCPWSASRPQWKEIKAQKFIPGADNICSEMLFYPGGELSGETLVSRHRCPGSNSSSFRDSGTPHELGSHPLSRTVSRRLRASAVWPDFRSDCPPERPLSSSRLGFLCRAREHGKQRERLCSTEVCECEAVSFRGIEGLIMDPQERGLDPRGSKRSSCVFLVYFWLSHAHILWQQNS